MEQTLLVHQSPVSRGEVVQPRSLGMRKAAWLGDSTHWLGRNVLTDGYSSQNQGCVSRQCLQSAAGTGMRS